MLEVHEVFLDGYGHVVICTGSRLTHIDLILSMTQAKRLLKGVDACVWPALTAQGRAPRKPERHDQKHKHQEVEG